MTTPQPAVPAVWPFDIGIVGTGIVGTHQLTREAEEVIRRCRRTFVIADGYGVADYLRTLCSDVIELGVLYEPRKNRLPTYHKMAAEVIAAAVADPPVCLATYGHPWVYCYPTTLITQAAGHLALHVEVFPGVSAFDTLIVDLGMDIADNGIQMYEATDLLLRRRPIQNDVNCVIWQPTVACDPTCPADWYEAQQFMPLQNYLLGFYPPDHEVSLVTSKTFPLTRSVVQRLRLGDLASELSGAPGVGTLYIPALTERPVEDIELMALMETMGIDAPAES
jgi:uncharacterized protein YabN with tetrapyrrole methylase and pyrophosphatase domain